MPTRISPSRRALSAAACGLGILIAATTAAAAANSAGTRRELEAARKSASGLRTQIAGTAAEVERLQAPVAALDARLSDLQVQLQQRTRRLAGIEGQLERQETQIARLEQEFEEAQDQLLARLVTVYKTGDPDLASVLVGASSVADAMDRRDAAEQVLSGDERLVREVERLEAQVRDARAATAVLHAEAGREARGVLATRDRVASTKARLVARQRALSQALGARAAELTSVEAREALLEGNLAALARSSRRLEQTILSAPALSSPATAPAPSVPDAAAASPAPSVAAAPPRAPSSSSSLIWPVSGPVVSSFGQRWGRMHSGIDIAAPSGTPIRAAASGAVIYAGWMEGYGNLVVVQHANGLSTAYGHLSRIGSSNGQSVGQGQTIGSVGCTGRCFGDHVHFETRSNGSAVDPMPYL